MAIAALGCAAGCAVGSSSPPSDRHWVDEYLAGSRALEDGDLDGAQRHLDDAARGEPQHVGTVYQQACLAARRGDGELANALLERAIDLGFKDAAVAEWDRDLETLRGDPRFAAAMARCRDLAGRETAPPFPGEVVAPGTYGALASDPAVGVIVIPLQRKTALVELGSGRTIAVLEGPHEMVGARAIDRVHHRIALTVFPAPAPSGSRDGQLRIHDLGTGELLASAPNPEFGTSLQFVGDGARLAIHQPFGRERNLVICSVPKLEVLEAIPTGYALPVFSADGRFVVHACPGSSTDVALHDLEKKSRVTMLPNVLGTDGAAVIGFREAAREWIVLDRSVGVLRAFDCVTGTLLHETAPSAVLGQSLRCLRDGRVVVIDERGSAGIYSGPEFRREREVALPAGYARFAAERPSGEWILDGGYERPFIAFDPESSRTSFRIGREGDSWFDAQAADLATSAEGNEMLWRRADGSVERVDPQSGRTLQRYTPGIVDPLVVVDPSRPIGWFASADGALEEFDWVGARVLRRVALGDAPCIGLAIDASDSALAVVDARGALHHVATATLEQRTLVDQALPFTASLAFFDAGKKLLIGRSDGSQAWIDVATWKVSSTLMKRSEPAFPFAWSNEGKLLATVAQGNAKSVVSLRDPQTDRVLSQVDVPSRVDCLTFSPDARELWVGTQVSVVEILAVEPDGTLRSARKLDVSDLDPIDTVEIGSIRFTRGGDLVVIASSGFGVVAAYQTASLVRRWNYEYTGGNAAAIQSLIDEDNDRVLVFGQGDWSARVVSLTTGNTLLDFAYRGFASLGPIPGNTRLIARTATGLELIDGENGRTLGVRMASESGGHAALVPSGWCAGDRASLARIQVALPGHSRSLLDLAPALLDVKKVRAAWQGVVLQPAKVP